MEDHVPTERRKGLGKPDTITNTSLDIFIYWEANDACSQVTAVWRVNKDLKCDYVERVDMKVL